MVMGQMIGGGAYCFGSVQPAVCPSDCKNAAVFWDKTVLFGSLAFKQFEMISDVPDD